ncbi:MAG: hypothetical protein QHH75_14950 [Bacillota bacterium]|nr:hypothetical protein [Bacillota bacterium]
MTSWLYADYLEINQDFIEIYSEEEDRKHPGAWKSFIPQESMLKLLESVIGVLERKAPKPLFIYGPYGTGKTFAAFVLKHLLEEGLEEVESYFTKYSSIKHLWPRWRALREQSPYLVVYRSSATDASNLIRLVYIIQERISRTLKEKGYKRGATETLRREVLQKLTDPRSTFNWPLAFEKHRSRFKDYVCPDEVITRLNISSSGSPETEESLLELIERVVRTLEEEDIVVLNTTDKLKEWIKEVIAQNGLKGLIFLWDEFTDFFRIPGALIDAVQELAHLATETPFYLALITHQAPDIVIKMDEESRAKFLERFHRHYLALADVTAYRLMGGVLQVKSKQGDDWERKRESLWAKVEKVSSYVIEELQGETKDDIRNLVPIHPYTARLLAAVARQFSSSQRTLFRFLKEEQPGRFSFPRFLREYPREGWFWLSADYLWEYFYAEDDPQYPEGVRRFIGQYRATVDRITDEIECRVYKAVLLLDLLCRRVVRDRSFEPIRSRLERIFEGILDRFQVHAALNSLCEKRLLQRYSVGFENVGYTLPLNLVDEKQVEQIKERLKQTNSFRALAKENGEIGRKLNELLQLSPPLGDRHKLCLAAVEELRSRQERVLPQEDLAPYEVGVVVVLPFEESELKSARELARGLSGEKPRVVYVITNQVFGERRWEEWLEQRALAEYAREAGERDNVRSTKPHRRMGKGDLDPRVSDVLSGSRRSYRGGEGGL